MSNNDLPRGLPGQNDISGQSNLANSARQDQHTRSADTLHQPVFNVSNAFGAVNINTYHYHQAYNSPSPPVQHVQPVFETDTRGVVNGHEFPGAWVDSRDRSDSRGGVRGQAGAGAASDQHLFPDPDDE
ncbi:hypothetical protein V5O48_016443, partial [Marasmius crinis-equi]